MKLNSQLFLLLFLIFNGLLAQKKGKDISSGFKQSINKFIEKIAVLKKNMNKLAAEREKVKKKKKESARDESEELDSDEYKVTVDDDNDSDLDLKILREEDKLFDFDEDISSNYDDDIDFETEDKIDFIEEVDDIEDSLKSESSFLDELLLKLNKQENEKRKNKAKIKDIISRTKNRDFLTGLKQKSQRARSEQRRLSGFLDRLRSSQSNLNRPRFRDSLGIPPDDAFLSSRFRDSLGIPPENDFLSSRFRDDPLDLVEENRSLLGRADKVPSDQVNKAFHLLDNIPGAKTKDGNIFVFTFADSNNPLLVFDG